MKFVVEKETQILDSGLYVVSYDDLVYGVCDSEVRAIVVCVALNECKPALMHAKGQWLSDRTCAECGLRKDKGSESSASGGCIC